MLSGGMKIVKHSADFTSIGRFWKKNLNVSRQQIRKHQFDTF